MKTERMTMDLVVGAAALVLGWKFYELGNKLAQRDDPFSPFNQWITDHLPMEYWGLRDPVAFFLIALVLGVLIPLCFKRFAVVHSLLVLAGALAWVVYVWANQRQPNGLGFWLRWFHAQGFFVVILVPALTGAWIWLQSLKRRGVMRETFAKIANACFPLDLGKSTAFIGGGGLLVAFGMGIPFLIWPGALLIAAGVVGCVRRGLQPS